MYAAPDYPLPIDFKPPNLRLIMRLQQTSIYYQYSDLLSASTQQEFPAIGSILSPTND